MIWVYLALLGASCFPSLCFTTALACIPSPLSELFHWSVNNKAVLGDLLSYCFPGVFCQKLWILAPVCASVLCVHLLQTKGLTAHLNSSTLRIASVGREERARHRGKYELITFMRCLHLHSDTEIWMCSLPSGPREVVFPANVLLLRSKSCFQWKLSVKYGKKETSTMVNT